MCLNEGYQTFDTVVSTATTKVKGQGFVPINERKDFSLNQSDPLYFERLFALNKDKNYRLLDAAGRFFALHKWFIEYSQKTF